MIKATSKVKLNIPKIRQLSAATVTALEKTGEALHTEVVQAQVVPRDDGTLQNESTFVDYAKAQSGKVSLVSSTPYARRLYFHPEYNFKTIENPDAKGKWLEDWMPGGKKQQFAPNAFKQFYRQGAGL